MKSPMKSLWIVVWVMVVAGAMTMASTAGAHQESAEGSKEKSSAKSKPTTARQEMVFWITDAENKLVELAEAMPEDKYAWRPAEGVRSTAEVFMHVAAANFGAPSFWGVKPPEGFDFKSYEKSLTAKADIQKALKASFAHMKKSLEAASEDDLNRMVTFFVGETSVRGGYMLLLSHAHEHLGQSIAYARSNGVTPPWSARDKEKAEGN